MIPSENYHLIQRLYKDAAEGGWPEMIQQLIAFLQKRKAESLKKNKKRGRKKLGPKASNNVTQTSNSARPLTPADAATRPAPASTPSTKSPTPKRGRTSTDPPVLRAVSTDDDTPTNANAMYTTYMLSYLGDKYKKVSPQEDASQWLRQWTIEDLSDECPQQENDCDCGIFLLLNLCCLLIDDALSLESYSQSSVDRKEVRKTVAHLLWKASSNRPVVRVN